MESKYYLSIRKEREIIKEVLSMFKTGGYSNYDIFSYLRSEKGITPDYFAIMLKYHFHNDFIGITPDERELLIDLAFDYNNSFLYKIRLDTLLSYKDDRDAINYLLSIDLLPSMLTKDISYARVAKHYSNEELNRLNYIAQIYTQFLKSKKLMEREQKSLETAKSNYEDAKEHVRKVIDNDLGKADSYYIEVLKTFNDPLYEKYKGYIQKKRSIAFATILSKGKKIIKLIQNGVPLDDDKTRPFDIMDYFEIISLSFDDLISNFLKGNISSKEMADFRRFTAKYKKLNYLNIEKLYNELQVFGAKLDSKGNIIPGTGREITKYEKENLVEYLKSKRLPLYTEVYNAAFLRWKKGYLKMPTDFEIQEVKESNKKEIH